MHWLTRPTRLVLILCALAIAAIPSLRGEFTWSVRTAVATAPRWAAWWFLLPAPRMRASDAERELNAHPKDLEVRIALACPFLRGTPSESANVATRGALGFPPQLGDTIGSAANRAMREALALAPRDPVVLSVAALRDFREGRLEFAREQELYVSSNGRLVKRIIAGWKQKFLTPAQIAGPLARLNAWARADPQNAAPHFFAAYLLLGTKRDGEALAQAEAAASKRFFQIYEMEIIGAKVHELRLRGLSPSDAQLEATRAYNMWPLVSRMRKPARIMDYLGRERLAAREGEFAFRCWLATGRIGTLMLQQEHAYLGTRMQGHSVQAIGYAPIYKRVWPLRPGPNRGPGTLVPGDAYKAFVASRGERAARIIRSELAAGESFRDREQAALRTNQHPARGFLHWRDWQLTFMLSALGAFLLWLLSLPLAWRAAPSLSRLCSGSLIALALLQFYIFAAMSALFSALSSQPSSYGLISSASPSPYSTWWTALRDVFARATDVNTVRSLGHVVSYPGLMTVITLRPFSPPLMLFVFAVIAAAWLARKRQVGFRVALGGAMRQSFATLIVVLAVIWIVSAAIAVREGGIYAGYAARGREVGELRMMEEFARDQGLHLKR